jgi:uncharacterized protein YggT (Ycf19 family)
MAGLIDYFLFILILAFVARAIISWLFVAGIRNDFLYRVSYTLGRFTEPIISPIRKVVPPIGGTIDISPMIAIFLLIFIRRIVASTL